MENLELSYYKRSITSPLSKLKEDVANGVKPVVSFTKYMETAVDKGERCERTKEILRLTIKNLNEFRRIIEFADLTVDFVKEFEQFLLKKGYAHNTYVKHIRNLRVFINHAIADGYIPKENYPFDRMKIKGMTSEHRTLTPDELHKVETLKIPEKKTTKRHILDAFLFCCYTGLRFSDFKQLRSNNIVFKEGLPWLEFKSIKTKVSQSIPIYLLFRGRALKILKKYKSIEELADLGCNADTNRQLKELINQAGIDHYITFHSARHTCATLLLNQGVPITTVQTILGHTSVRTTQLYAAILSETIISDITRANNKKSVANVKIFADEENETPKKCA